jgi:MFS family permease
MRVAMLLRALLSQNVVIGCAFGGFGVSMIALQMRYGIGRGTASLALALGVLTMSLAGPLVAAVVQRFGLRSTMLVGLLLSATGYGVLAWAPSIGIALAAFAGLVGPGIALAGALPASLLAGGWYPERRGRAVGLANMPVLVALVPLAGAAMIAAQGLEAFYLLLAGLHLPAIVAVAGVREPPAGRPSDTRMPGISAPPVAIVHRPIFWLMALGGGLLNSAAITGAAQIVAIAGERGIATGTAAALASLLGGASIAGALLSGWLSDRIGGAWALALIASGFAAAWALIAATSWLPLMIFAILLIGMCGSGVFPAVNVLSAHVFGLHALGRTLGLFGVFTLPLTFLLPPGAGLLRDIAGNYSPVMLVIIAGCGMVAALFLALGRLERRMAAA